MSIIWIQFHIMLSIKLKKKTNKKRLVRLKIALKATKAVFKEFGFEVKERIVVKDLESNKIYK